MKSLQEYRRMQQVMLRSEGARLYSDLLALDRSLRVVFLGNYDQLLGYMSSQLDDLLSQMRLFAVKNREGLNSFLDEVERLYHNVAAAALSLRDHSYRVRDKWLQPAAPGDTLRECRVTNAGIRGRTYLRRGRQMAGTPLACTQGRVSCISHRRDRPVR